jgi:hypothetical protein
VHCRYVPAAILRVNRDEAEEAADADETGDDAAHDVTNHEVIEPPGDETEPGTTDTTGKAD